MSSLGPGIQVRTLMPQNSNPASEVRLRPVSLPKPPGPHPVTVISPGGFLSAMERAGFSGSPI